MEYVLIVFIVVGGSAAPALMSARFKDKAACERAVLNISSHETTKDLFARCYDDHPLSTEIHTDLFKK